VKVEQAAQHRRGTVFVISGPSGVGKTSLCKQILATMPQVTQSVAYTTRAARPHEQDGYAYHFISREAFAQRIAAGDFLEWARVHDHLYGTSRQQVEEATAAGQDILLAIDVQSSGVRGSMRCLSLCYHQTGRLSKRVCCSGVRSHPRCVCVVSKLPARS
jgi:guanylate kinase